MPLVEARSQLAAKIESVEGTAEALAAADAVLAAEIKFDPDISIEELNLSSSSLSPFSGIPGHRMAKLTFKCPFKGSGAAGTAPEIGKLLQACGYDDTVVASTSVTYLPASSGIPSLTMAHYLDGKRYLMAGARGNFTLNLNSGKPGIISFDFIGTSVADSDVALLSSVSYQSSVAKAFQNANFTINSYAAIIEAMVIGSGNALALRDSANSIQGYLSANITKRMATLSLNPEDVLLATHDFWDDWESGDLVALSAVVGSAAGNICTITAPKIQYGKLSPGSRNGNAVAEIGAILRRDSGDDELSLAFT